MAFKRTRSILSNTSRRGPSRAAFAEHKAGEGGTQLTRKAFTKAALLFANFLFIIMAYYMVKTASRSMILEDASSAILPYIWIGSALLLMLLVPIYQVVIARVSRFKMLFGTLVLIAAALAMFWFRFENPSVADVAVFYVFVDIFSVVLVEQFWSLTNSTYRSMQAKKWYGIIGSGGLVGGAIAGFTAAFLIENIGIKTADLLLVSIGLIGCIAACTAYLAHTGLFADELPTLPEKKQARSWEILKENNYLLLVAVILLLAQLAAPFVEYQFMTLVEQNYIDQEKRTVYISQIFGWISSFALLINLLLTPLMHRLTGAIGGLLVQPAALLIGSVVFMLYPVLNVAALLRVTDRGLSYSINRASRELLYVPISAETLYRAKAWIDMLGYRMFKVLGAGVIILLTEKFDDPFSLAQLAIVIVAICISWTMSIVMIRERYNQVEQASHIHNPLVTST